MYEIDIDLESAGYAASSASGTGSSADDLSAAAVAGAAVGAVTLGAVGWHVGRTYGFAKAWWEERTPAGIEKSELLYGLGGAAIGTATGAAGGAVAGYIIERKLQGEGSETAHADDWAL